MTHHIPVSGHKFFHFLRYFLIWKQLFRILETYFSIFFTWLVQTDFLPSGNSTFGECYFTASRNHYWNKEKTVLRVRAHCCYCATDFLANGNHLFSIFQKLLLGIVHFPSSESVFFNEILHSDQWKLFYFVQRFFLQVKTAT